MRTDEDVLRYHDDLEMMKRPHLWPGGRAVLFVKHTRKASGPGPYDLYGYIHAEDPTVFPGPTKDFTEPIPYASFEAMLADGWIVD